MNSQKTMHRDRAAILADINAIQNIVEGTLAEMRRNLQGGGSTVYHNLQHWKDGRNTTVYVPKDRVETVREGIENRRRMEALMAELAAAGTADALAGDAGDGDKKKRKMRSPVSRARSRG